MRSDRAVSCHLNVHMMSAYFYDEGNNKITKQGGGVGRGYITRETYSSFDGRIPSFSSQGILGMPRDPTVSQTPTALTVMS